MALVPPLYPHSKIPPKLLSLQSSLPARASLSPPLSSSSSVWHLFVVVPRSTGSPAVCPYDCLADGAILPLVVFPTSQRLMAFPPDLCVWLYLARVWVEGA